MDAPHLKTMEDKIKKCMGCGICRGVWERKDEAMCPVWATRIGFEDSTPRGRVTVAQDILDGYISYSKALAESVFRCTDCRSCAVTCDAMDPETGEPIVDVPSIVEAMRMDLIDHMIVPEPVRNYLESMQIRGNPYRKPPKYRWQWAEGLELEEFDKQEYLLYIGDAGAFEELGSKMACSIASLLLKAGVSFGILGSEEGSDGNDVKVLGEEALFEQLALNNIEKFQDKSIKKIITLDPHAYNAFKNFYPALNSELPEIKHYTEILAELVKKDAFSFTGEKTGVTFHDPCYLCRHNDICSAPREVIQCIPGLELAEMKRNRKSSFCCGGGGGNFYTDMIGGYENSPARLRVREAFETGADVLAVACPLCLKMLDDAVKSEGLEDRFKVMDIAELIVDSMGIQPDRSVS